MYKNNDLMEVDFETYCEICVNQKKSASDKPCCECLETPMRENTRKPTYWKEKNNIHG